MVDGYTLVLPTAAELLALYNDAASTAPAEWGTGNFWSASLTGSTNYHYAVNLATGASSNAADSTGYKLVLQVLQEDIRDVAYDKISAAAQANTASTTSLSIQDFVDAGISAISEDNFSSILTALNTNSVVGSSVDTYEELRDFVDAYIALLAHADGASSTESGVTLAQYTSLGVTGILDAQHLKLLNQVIDIQTNGEVDTVSKVQAFADAVSSLMQAAAGTGSEVSLADLQLLDINGVTAANLASVQSAIAGTINTGEEVDSYSELHMLVSQPATVLDLTDPTTSINLRLINPLISQDGKLYYYLDHDGDNTSDGGDTLTHDVLDTWLNGSTNTVVTQESGAVAGVDDARTAIMDGYTIVLPTLAEITALQTEAIEVSEFGWNTGDYYWTSTLTGSTNYHYRMSADGTISASNTADTSSAKVIVEVLRNNTIAGTANAETITGTQYSEIITGLAGDDVIMANGGGDMIDAGAGADQIHINKDNVANLQEGLIDGGADIDTLHLIGESMVLDFTTLDNQHVQNIEMIDMTDTHDHELKISAADVLDLSTTTDTLKIVGDSGDEVTLVNMADTGMVRNESGVTYKVYAEAGVAVELWIDEKISVVL